MKLTNGFEEIEVKCCPSNDYYLVTTGFGETRYFKMDGAGEGYYEEELENGKFDENTSWTLIDEN